MSDPLTDAEIEGVLPSIRRLISQEVRKTAAANTRFVLTDAHRVYDPAKGETNAVVVAQSASPARDHPVAPYLLGPASVAAQEGGEPPAEKRQRSVFSDGLEPLIEAEVARLIAAAVSEEVGVTAVSESQTAGRAPEHQVSEQPTEEAPFAEVEEQTSPEPPIVLGQAIGAIEAKPDAPGANPIEDDALRNMVSDIVRAELNGVLGERITRNVRKLVRREIHRVLISRDLD